MTESLWSISSGNVAFITMFTFVGTIAFSYSFCSYINDECPKFLPTISNTWDYVPGNYLSRFTVNFGCFMLLCVQWLIFWVDCRSRTPSLPIDKTLLILGTLATYFLSLVGAICDNDNLESCQGNGAIHDFCAVSFFVIYDCEMLIITSRHSGLSTTATTLGRTMLLAVSFVSKIRYFMEDDTALAVLEWTDVGVILAFTIDFVREYGSGYTLGWTDQEGSSSPVAGKFSYAPISDRITLQTISSRSIATTASIMFTVALIVPLAWGAHTGQFKPLQALPALGDLWDFVPGNYFGRWCLMSFTCLTCANHVSIFFMNTISVSASNASQVLTQRGILMLAIPSLCCLGLSGCINEGENSEIHPILFLAWLASYDVVMALLVATSTKHESYSFLALCTVISALSKIRLHEGVMHRAGVSTVSLEWMDTIACGLFIAMYVYGHEESKNIGISVDVETREAVQERKPLLGEV